MSLIHDSHSRTSGIDSARCALYTMKIPSEIMSMIFDNIPLRDLCRLRHLSRRGKDLIDKVVSRVVNGSVNDIIEGIFGMKLTSDDSLRYITSMGYVPSVKDVELCILSGGKLTAAFLEPLFSQHFREFFLEITRVVMLCDNVDIVEYLLLRSPVSFHTLHFSLSTAVIHGAVKSTKAILDYCGGNVGIDYEIIHNAIRRDHVEIYTMLTSEPNHEDLEAAIRSNSPKMVEHLIGFTPIKPCCLDTMVQFTSVRVLDAMIKRGGKEVREILDLACSLRKVHIIKHFKKAGVDLEIEVFPPMITYGEFEYAKTLIHIREEGVQYRFVEVAKRCSYRLEDFCEYMEPLKLTLESIDELIKFYIRETHIVNYLKGMKGSVLDDCIIM